MSETPNTSHAAAFQASLTPKTIFTTRTLITITQSAMIAYWTGPALALFWVAYVLFLELAVNPFLVTRFVTPLLKTNPERARANGAGIIAFGTTMHCVVWGPVWFFGGPTASILGVVWLIGALINAITYFTNSRLQFAACLAPSAIVCAVIMVIQHPINLFVLMMAAMAISVHMVRGYHERNVLNTALVKSKAERRAAIQSSQAKTQFLANMSHELRTPLNAIIGYAEIIVEDQRASLNRDSAADAERITRAAKHLLELINEVLDFSKIDAGRMEVSLGLTDVPALISEIADTLAPMAQANRNRIAFSVAPDIHTIVTDAGKLRQCLLNLTSNACKFTNDGSVFIDVRMNTQGLMQIAVKDTGCGVSTEQAARLFHPFVQADASLTRKRDGTGLGLVITRNLAQLLGGDVVMDSTPGIGSTFTMTLAPQALKPAAANEAAGKKAADAVALALPLRAVG